MVSTPNFTDGTWRIVSTGHHGGTPNGDILWQNVLDQSLVLWRQDGGTTVSKSTLPGLDDYDVVAIGDFDGDGVEDVFLRNEATDDNRIILGGSNSRENTANSLWVPEAATDLDGDGKDDIVLVSPDGTMLAGRLMNGTTVVSQTNFASGYVAGDQLLAVYNGEGANTFDSLWFDQSANQFDITSYDSGVRTVTDSFTVGLGKDYVRTGDFDGDGDPDHLFRDPEGSGEGSAEVVFTNGTSETGRLVYNNEFRNIHVEDAGDFDDDGQAELLLKDEASQELIVANVQKGTGSSDKLVGSDSSDFIDGQGGNDKIFGEDGDDFLLGEDGVDEISGGRGDDRIDGGEDNNNLYGGDGDDSIGSGSDDDLITGNAGNDSLTSDSGMDIFKGGDGDDYIVAGNFGYAHVQGGDGDDTIIGDDNGIYEGGAGDDVIIGENGLDLLYGGDGDDYLEGGLSVDTIYGGAGNDIIFGVDRAGLSGTSDTLYGGSGQDFFYLGTEDDRFYTGSGQATIKDFNPFQDKIVLNGFSSDYNFVDTGSHVEIRQASDNNVIAIVENVASVSDVQENVMYIG